MRSVPRPFRLGALLAMLLVLLVPTAAAQSDDCAREIQQAEDAYFAADFDRAVQLLRTCLDEAALSDTATVRVYRWLAFAHLGRGASDDARLAVESLLDVAPAFTPDPTQDRPDFVALVEDVRASRRALAERTEAEDGGGGWLRWVGGAVGVAAVGTAAAVLLGGGSDDGGGGNGGSGSLPGPPLPNN